MINPDFAPSSMEEAVDSIIQSLSEEDRKFILKNNSNSIHFTTGMSVRNEWSFWEDSPLRRDAIKRWGLAHADDLSGMLFEWVFAKVRGQEFDVQKFGKRIQAYWKNYGTTSCGAMHLKEDGTPA